MQDSPEQAGLLMETSAKDVATHYNLQLNQSMK
jgi:hypothetical protein